MYPSGKSDFWVKVIGEVILPPRTNLFWEDNVQLILGSRSEVRIVYMWPQIRFWMVNPV